MKLVHCNAERHAEASRARLALHARLGFTPAGTLKQVGYKFGRWLDLCFVQRCFDTPQEPRDG